ncbi:hypothetical protein ACFQZQ_02275 [Lysobacter koreensis]|uniref:Holdfast attachment protein HfaA n=1 Tax=Lysobacter koreensis TaxID=266122 RepID=A0ABW2YI43_9GAMM
MRSFKSIAHAGAAALVATLGLIQVAGATDLGAAASPVYLAPLPVAADLGAMALEASQPPSQVDGIGQALDSGELEDFRGGDESFQEVDINGQVTGNTANRIVSGGNSVSDGAFGNASGINTVIQNSGSNVLIQNGMIVNVQFVDPGL